MRTYALRAAAVKVPQEVLPENPVELNTQTVDTDIPDEAGLARPEGTKQGYENELG